MKFARVLLPINSNETFVYEIPEDLRDDDLLYKLVAVEFGSRRMYGIITELTDETNIKKTKQIMKIEWESNIDINFIKLLEWLTDYYFTTAGNVLRNALPSETKSVKRYVCVKKNEKLHELYVMTKEKPLPKGEILKIIKKDCDFETLLNDKSIVEDLTAYQESKPKNVELTNEQSIAFENVKTSIEKSEFKSYLLYGRPSTGKTEVYMKLLHYLINNTNKNALVLLPEIGLADVLFKRFNTEFGSTNVCVMHSELSEGERGFYLHEINEDKRRIVVGTRSAIFSPIKNLGLIIIDEEQDISYKQYDKSPFYNGRDGAVYLAYLNNCPVVLASATPSAESYNNAMTGKYELLKLNDRFMGTPQPEVRIIYNTNVSRNVAVHAVDAIADALSENGQVIVFLNRRGYLNLYKCSKCGEYYKCDNCSVSYSFHKSLNGYICHYCSDVKPAGSRCNLCGGDLTPSGVWGTEMIEGKMKSLFKGAVVDRFDIDSVSKKGERRRIIEKMINHETHILVGTQMVSKGYDLPDVNTVVILNADSVINLPDIRSEERFMQLLVQTSGRAGRRGKRGLIIVETGVESIHLRDFIENLDYEKFIKEELLRRKNQKFPPFARMLKIMHKNIEKEEVVKNLEILYDKLKKNESRNIKVFPPGFNYIEKVNKNYRGEMFILYKDFKDIKKIIVSIGKVPFNFYIDNDTL